MIPVNRSRGRSVGVGVCCPLLGAMVALTAAESCGQAAGRGGELSAEQVFSGLLLALKRAPQYERGASREQIRQLQERTRIEVERALAPDLTNLPDVEKQVMIEREVAKRLA